MPVFDDILEHRVLGREYRRGRKEGREEGREQGRYDGELRLIRIQLEGRFGEIPADLDAKLPNLTAAELEQLARRIVHAASVEALSPLTASVQDRKITQPLLALQQPHARDSGPNPPSGQ